MGKQHRDHFLEQVMGRGGPKPFPVVTAFLVTHSYWSRNFGRQVQVLTTMPPKLP